MAVSDWEDAVRERVLLRMALVGANGSGKTLAALRIATGLGGTIGVIDTEKGRSRLYADRFAFKIRELHDHRPESFIQASREAADMFDNVIIDSISHEWLAVLVEADRFGDWKDLSPRHADFVEALTALPTNLIVTMRAKVKYGVEEVNVPGRDKPRQVITRLGVGPVQRDSIEYEFDVLAYLDTDHMATFANRCDPLVDKTMEIDDEMIAILKKWLEEGEPVAPQRVVNAQDVPVPTSWANIQAAVRAYSDGVWEDMRVFMAQAAQHLFNKTDELDEGQRNILFQKSAAVTIKLLENKSPGELPTPQRLEWQAWWSQYLDGHVLDGPEWSMHPDEAAAGRPPRSGEALESPPTSEPPAEGAVPAAAAAPETPSPEPTAAPEQGDASAAAAPSPDPAPESEEARAKRERRERRAARKAQEEAVVKEVETEFPGATEADPGDGWKGAEPVQTRDVPAE